MRASFQQIVLLAFLAAIIPLHAADNIEPLFTRTFRLDPNPLMSLDFPELVAPTPTDLIQAYLSKSGLQFPIEGDGKKLFYNDRTGVLLVRATLAGLDQAETALQKLNVAPHQIRVEVRIAEYNLDDLPPALPDHFNLIFRARQTPQTLKASVLTDPDTRILLRAFEQTTADLISAPTITTLSGRQARIAIEQQPPIITDPPFTAPGKDPKAKWSPNPSR